jgi:PAS domain S-box-containing protein
MSSPPVSAPAHASEGFAGPSIEDLYNNAPCGYHSLDAQGVIVAINDTELGWLGYSREDLVRRRVFRDLLTPASQAEFDRNFGIFKQRGWVRDLEFEIVAKDGHLVTVLLSATAVRDPDGRFLASRSTLTDISARKRAELERDRVYTLSPDLLCIASPDGYFKRVNPAFTRVLGWSAAEMLARPFLDFVHPDDRDATRHEVERQVVAGEPVLHFANRYRHQNGSWRWLSWTSIPQSDGLLYATARDVTDLRGAEETMREADRRMAALVKDLNDIKAALDQHAIVTVTDPQGRITSANDKFTDIFEYTRQELLGQNHRLVNSGVHPKAFFADLWATIQRGRIWKGEICNRSKSGRLGWFDTTIVPFLNADGVPTQYVSIQTDLTERKHAEDTVRRFNNELEALVETRTAELQGAVAALGREKLFSDTVIDSVTGFFFVLDTEGRFVRWNTASLKVLGLTEDEMRAAYALSLVHEADVPMAAAKIVEAFTSGYSEAEVRLVGQHGIRHALLSSRRTDIDGATYLVGAGVDITERKIAEAALGESDRFARASLDALDAHIAVLDATGVILAANHTWKAFALENGVTPGRVSEGVNYLAVCDAAIGDRADEAPRIATGIRAVIAGSQDTFQAEYPCHAPGERRWFHCRVTRFPGDGDVRVVVAHEDVTKIKQSQFAREQALTSLDATGDGVFIFDPDSLRFSYVNQGAVHQLGYGRDELLAMTPLALLPSATSIWFQVLVQQMRAGTVDARQYTAKHRCKDGREMPVEVNLQFVRSGDDVAPRFIAVVRDITDRQRAQDEILALNADLERRIAERTDQLDKAREAAEAANRAKSAFLANMSHEIRTPLNAIAGMVELLEHTTDAAERGRMLRVTQESAKALADIIDDVLDLSKIEAGRFDVFLEPMSLRDVTTAVVEVFSSSASAKNLYLRLAYDDRLPLAVRCDSVRLRQILFNLVSNAIKFTAAGGIEIRASLEGEASGMVQVRFDVSDTGIGISPEAQARIFQPFVQAEVDTTRKFGGTGLGLAISGRLADLLGGSLELTSEPGRGTTATLRLTLDLADAAALPVRSNAEQDPLPTVSPDTLPVGGRLLIVDDSAINRQVLLRQLATLGYEADEATNGREALDLWMEGDYVLIIADCHMPEMDGYQLARSVRDLEAITPGLRPVPIVGYTANAGKDSRDLCAAAGMDDALIKPVPLRVLGRTIAQWLRQPPVEVGAPEPTSVTVEAETSAPPVDWTRLLEITGGDRLFGREMLHAFVAAKRPEVDHLAALLAEGSLDEIARLAHRLKGAARTVAVPSVAAACEQIEQAARTDQRGTALGARRDLRAAFDRLATHVREHES